MVEPDSTNESATAAAPVIGPQPAPDRPLEEKLANMAKMPLFMNALEAEEAGNSNSALEAIKALAYEGPPEEVAQNFREHGNESFREKRWNDAIHYYTQALEVKCGKKDIDEACYANQAACNLELKNYRRVNLDCAEAIKLNPNNVKAWYRAARACLALDKLDEARDCADRGLSVDPENKALTSVSESIDKRKAVVDAANKARVEREQAKRAKDNALRAALRKRNIAVRVTTTQLPDLGDSPMSLSEPTDPGSTLCFPVVMLYPLHSQSDFIQSFPEDITPYEQLQEILAPDNPPPWDTAREYGSVDAVDVFAEKKKYGMHDKAGLSKMGKNITIGKILGEGKLEVVDGVVSLLVVPKKRVTEFIEGWKKKNLV